MAHKNIFFCYCLLFTLQQSSTQFYPFDLPCISACETTQRQYWHLQRLHVERLLTTTTTTTTTQTKEMATTSSTSLQPQLLHDNETLNTLTLKWPITTATTSLLPALYLASRPFNIQYQYVLKASPSQSSLSSVVPSATSSSSSAALTVNDTPDINSQEGQQHSKQYERLEDQQSAAQDKGVEQDNGVADDNDSVNVAKEDEEDETVAQQQQQWWNLADYNCNENFECDIMDGLMPYTSYKVRGFCTAKLLRGL